jgi:hypothetical protein
MGVVAPLFCAGLIMSGAGYLHAPAFDITGSISGEATPYHPQPGDIFLATDRGFFAQLGHRLAGAASPHHSGLVVAMPDGDMGLLEAGPHNTLRVRILDVYSHARSHECNGEVVWFRQRAVPLTCEESERLTEFALAQNGKPFAVLRLVGQLTPFRCRGPMRTRVLARPHGDRVSYFCSELVTEACVAAGLLDPARARPAATYPCDLFHGQSRNRFLDRNLEINDAWLPPARWTSTPTGE